MTRSQKGFAHILPLLLVLILVGIGGWWMWKNDKLNLSIEKSTPDPSVYIQSHIPTDWLTYNTTLFSLKHPSNITVGRSSSRNNVEILGVVDGRSLKTFIEPDNHYSGDDDYFYTKDITVDGKNAILQLNFQESAHKGTSNIFSAKLVVENVAYFKQNSWIEDGVFNLVVYIDGEKESAEKIAEKIISTLDFKEIVHNGQINLKLANLNFEIPNTWWYEYGKNDTFLTEFYILNHSVNTTPYSFHIDKSINNFLLSFEPSPVTVTEEHKKYQAEYEKNYLEWKRTTDITINGVNAKYTERKRNKKVQYNSSTGPGNLSAEVKIVRTEGVYTLSGTINDPWQKTEFDRVMTSFEFED